MRALVLFSILLLFVAGAFLFQQVRYGKTHGLHPVKAQGPPLPGALGDVVIEVGGGPPPRSAAKTESRRDAAAPETRPADPVQPNAAPLKVDVPAADAPALTVKLRRGDSLYSIGLKYYRSGSPSVLKDLAVANRLGDGAKLKEGAVLTLPPIAGGRARG